MAKLPAPINTTSEQIVQWYEKKTEAPRPHLGCSELGKECKRALWYSFRWASNKKFPGRIKRLFSTGFREEARFLEELRGIGAEVHEVDPETQRQHRFTGYKGHLAGSCDAIGRGLPEAPKTWAIIEFKTHGDKSFTDLVKKKVQEAKPEHYAQLQLYMGFAELERALYLSVNKNTDELYSEWVTFDASEFEKLQAKAQLIIDADEPPLGVSTDPAWYQCKMCDHHAVCHTDQIPQKNCRTCLHSTPVEDAHWSCAQQKRLLPFEEQRLGCRSHLFIPPLINWAEPLDAGADWVKYQDRDSGLIFANVCEDTDPFDPLMPADVKVILTSAELPVSVRPMVNDPFISQVQKAYPGSRILSSKITEPVQ